MFDHLLDGRWWDIGLDLVTGCTPVSAGCDHCWSAERAHRAGYQKNPKMRARYGGLTDTAGHWTGEVRPQWQDLDKIGRARKPQVYTFWNDLFHPGVPDEFVDEVWDRIVGRLEHFYIICTKRPERALEYFQNRSWVGNALKKSLMLITTIENQEMANLRLPILFQIPGVLYGVSYEPALGPVDFTRIMDLVNFGNLLEINVLTGQEIHMDDDHQWTPCEKLDWLILGGETGPRARPLHPDWVRQTRDQAVAAGVPFFFKSWGEWLPSLFLSEAENQTFWQGPGKKAANWGTLNANGDWFPCTTPWNGNQGDDSPEREFVMYRVGKKTAGRLLDGRTWDEVPKGIL